MSLLLSHWAYAFSLPHLIVKIHTFIAWFWKTIGIRGLFACIEACRLQTKDRVTYLLDPRVPQTHARSICFGNKKLRRWHSKWFTLQTHGPADVNVSKGIWDLWLEGPLHLDPRRAAFSSTGEVAGSERGRPVAATGLVRKPEEKSRKNEKMLPIFWWSFGFQDECLPHCHGSMLFLVIFNPQC